MAGITLRQLIPTSYPRQVLLLGDLVSIKCPQVSDRHGTVSL